MKRWLGSAATTVALLSIAVAAAAVNVRILDSNRTDTSSSAVQAAAEVLQAEPVESAVEATTVDAATTTMSSDNEAVDAPTATDMPVPLPEPSAVESPDDSDRRFGDKWRGPMWKRDRGPHQGRQPGREFVPLTPPQGALLRVAALAQVSPLEARDAANGIGSDDVIERVKLAAERIGVPLAEIGAVTNLPPERGRRHGAMDDQRVGDDDD